MPSTLSLSLRQLDPTDPLLNHVAALVPTSKIPTPEIQNVIAGMLALAAGKGHDPKDTRQMVGLAAPQVGVSQRIIIIDTTADGSHKSQHLVAIINPCLSNVSKQVALGREGCWSCGTICGAVERAQSVTVTGVDADGQPLSLDVEGFVARVAQHEVDHLEGIRFPDRIPVDKPERLHTVLPEEFPAYRKDWATWTTLCPRERWLQMKLS